MEWEGSSDCMTEYKNFNSCMESEKQRLKKQPLTMSSYNYIQSRLDEKKKEEKFDMILSADQEAAINQMKVSHDMQRRLEADRSKSISH